MPKRIAILVPEHLASTPRMVKAADSLQGAGYAVRVVSSDFLDWCRAAEEKLAANAAWRRRTVPWHPRENRVRYQWTRLRYNLYRKLAERANLQQCSLTTLAQASCRSASELIQALTEEPADLVYAGTARGIAPGAVAAQRLGAKLAVDLEDLHTAEQQETPAGRYSHRLMAEVERRVIPLTTFYTTSSTPIAERLEELYQQKPIVLHNVFSLPDSAPRFDADPSAPLRLLWFSQYIGTGRGLEDVIAACRMTDRPVVLGLIGNAGSSSESLLTEERTAGLRIEMLGTVPPESLVDVCRQWDVGLATETGHPPNREFCLTNKLGTYILAGMAIAASETAGQRELATDLGAGAWNYPVGDAAKLAEGLRRWADDRQLLAEAKRASWQAAVRRWRWDHPAEEGVLLAAVEQAIGRP